MNNAQQSPSMSLGQLTVLPGNVHFSKRKRGGGSQDPYFGEQVSVKGRRFYRWI